MADEDKKITITLAFENGEFNAKINDAGDSLDKFRQKGEGAFSKMMFGAIGLNQTLELSKKIFDIAREAFEKPIEAAAQQEAAIQHLNQSLANAGTYTKAASDRMQEFAESMSRTTQFSDNTVLGLESFARTLTKSNEQAENLTKAAIELSAATGIDAHDAVQRLGLSLSGVNARLDRLVPGIHGMTQATMMAGGAIDEVNRKFAGTAEGGARTFLGLQTIMTHGMEELAASLGKLVTASPGVKALMTMINEGIFSITDALKGIKGDMIGDLIRSMFDLGKSIVTYLVAPMEMVYNVSKITFDAIKFGIQEFLLGLLQIPSYIAENVVGPLTSLFSKDAGDAVKNFAKDARETLQENAAQMGDELAQSFDKAMDFSASQKALGTIDQLGKRFDELRDKMKDFGSVSNKSITEFDKGAENLNKTLQKGLVSTLANSFAALGKAFAQGKNGLEEFGKALLSSIGQVAIQIGTMLVEVGLGFTPMGIIMPAWAAAGTATVAKGLALITLGGALAASGGGGGSSTGGGDTGGGSSGGSVMSASAPETLKSQDMEKKKGDIVFMGPVFNSRETQQTIVELVREGSDITDWNIVGQGGKPYT